MGAFFDRNDPIISYLLLAGTLIALDHSDDSALQNTAREGRLVHQNQHINGIAVVGLGGGNKSEGVGKRHTGGQHLFQLKDALVGIEGELITAALWSFDYNPQKSFVRGIKRLE